MVTLRRRERELARASRALDAGNFFLADVRDALGPYLAVYLLTEREWDAASIGLVMSISTIAGILAQTPSGALVDATKAKRGVMVAASDRDDRTPSRSVSSRRRTYQTALPGVIRIVRPPAFRSRQASS